MRLVRQVPGDAQRFALVARMGSEELDELAPLRCSTPGTEAKRRRQLPTALGANAHGNLLSAEPYPE
jgi:hypothetical protein